VGLFDVLRDTVFRRGIDDPLVKKGAEALNDLAGERRRAEAAERWPLASDPGGVDVFAPLLVDRHWILSYADVVAEDAEPHRFDGLDTCGWHFGYGFQLMGVDVDGSPRAGGNPRPSNDTWVEVAYEPVFDELSFAALTQLWFTDIAHDYRRIEVPDDLPELRRQVVSGRHRGNGEWCAATLLPPLVLRVRVDTNVASRERAKLVLHSVLERLDLDALAAWRSAVEDRRRAAAPPAGEVEPDTAEGPDTVRLPGAAEFKAGLDGPATTTPPALDHDALGEAFGGPVERVRSIVLAGVGEGVRIQAQGGRALDVVTVTDDALLTAFAEQRVEGVEFEERPDVTGYAWANLDDHDDGACAAVLRVEGGPTYLLRVRGMKRLDVHRPFRVAIAGLTA
jgi:hypothetical protein